MLRLAAASAAGDFTAPAGMEVVGMEADGMEVDGMEVDGAAVGADRHS
jgi:hypothetical protein